jgi:hypothetical protein
MKISPYPRTRKKNSTNFNKSSLNAATGAIRKEQLCRQNVGQIKKLKD